MRGVQGSAFVRGPRSAPVPGLVGSAATQEEARPGWGLSEGPGMRGLKNLRMAGTDRYQE
jgi:hypothetical protein